ncbi:MAG TPA: ATP-binding cassette domain-containing protein, partial [Actinomycetota bacterium]
MNDAAANVVDLKALRATGPPKLAVRDLVKTRKNSAGAIVTAVDHVSFEVAVGEFVCLLGPSGCGKTSILNMLAGLETPTSGSASMDGRAIEGPGPDRTVMFQEPALFPWLTVAGNVELALKLKDIPATERRERAMGWISNVGLASVAAARPHELSAGMRQRVALARALASEPDVLLGDEP